MFKKNKSKINFCSAKHHVIVFINRLNRTLIHQDNRKEILTPRHAVANQIAFIPLQVSFPMTNRSNLNYSAAAKGTKRAAVQSTASFQIDKTVQHKLG